MYIVKPDMFMKYFPLKKQMKANASRKSKCKQMLFFKAIVT